MLAIIPKEKVFSVNLINKFFINYRRRCKSFEEILNLILSDKFFQGDMRP